MEKLSCRILVVLLGAYLPLSHSRCDLALKGELNRLTHNSQKAIRLAELPPVYDIALPTETVAQIKTHPLYEKLKVFRDRKQRVVLDSYIREGESLDPQDPTNTHIGETTQGKFLQKIVDELTEYDPQAKDTEEVKVQIDIVDRFEAPADRNTPVSKITKHSDFDMTDLKQANPNFGPQYKAQLRQALGIDANKTVLSIYSDRLDAKGILHVKNFIHDVKAPEVIYFSRGGKEVLPLDIDILEREYIPRGYRVMKLSQVGPLTYKTFPKLLIVNDMRGKVPYLHSISNLALIEGPINFFEPLSVGTPTYWVNLTKDSYSQTRIKQMAKNAARTGIFASEESGKDIASFYNEMKDKELSEAPLISERNGTRALDNVLDDLDKVLSRSTP